MTAKLPPPTLMETTGDNGGDVEDNLVAMCGRCARTVLAGIRRMEKYEGARVPLTCALSTTTIKGHSYGVAVMMFVYNPEAAATFAADILAPAFLAATGHHEKGDTDAPT